MAWRNQRNPLSNHLRHDMDDELIHLPGIEKGGDKLSPAHQPNILALFRAQPLGEDGHAFADDIHFWAGGFRESA